MLFPLFPNTAMSTPELCAADAAIKCLFAYTHGLEGCQIEVETVDGIIMLSGSAPSDIAIRKALAIAADFTTKPVICRVQVTASKDPGSDLSTSEQANNSKRNPS